jgi:diketogulonate reductase-like aldo/keto reductase
MAAPGSATRPFGTTGRAVATVGQGSWRLEQADEGAAIAALRHGLDLGLTHVDTAEMYGEGAAEAIIGKAIAGRRDEVFLVSKVLPSNASRRRTVQACERSLKRLGVERLDCYLLHWRGSTPLAETVAAFADLQQAGKIASWGVSNFDVADLDEITALAGPPACNQVLYHVAERHVEHAVIPWCETHGTAVVAYTPFGLSAAPYAGRTAAARVLGDIAAAHGATPRQVALAFLLRNPALFVIPKAVSAAHVADNAAAMTRVLEPREIEAISAAFPRAQPDRELPTV